MWLLKTEPSAYGYAQLERDGRAVWDGVTNPAALRNLRAMRVGERVLVYHTGDEKAVVGVARVTREAYPDPKAGNPRLLVVEIAPVGRLRSAVPLARIKALPEFALSPLVRQGRLSVVPLTEEQWSVLEREGQA
jgi:predicted RNA-binding protein with PUA-like domain